MTLRVLFATDGTEDATGAARQALQKLLPGDVEPVFVTVAPEGDDPADFAGGIEGPLATPDELEADRQAARVAGDAALASTLHDLHAGVVEQTRLEGDAGPEICLAAERERAGLVVVGPPRSSLLDRLFSPSTVNYLVRHAPCPVLVVRP